MFNVPFTIAFEAWNHHQPLQCGTLNVAHIKGYWIYQKHEYYRLKTHNLVNFKGTVLQLYSWRDQVYKNVNHVGKK
jgi:hypothetical protein